MLSRYGTCGPCPCSLTTTDAGNVRWSRGDQKWRTSLCNLTEGTCTATGVGTQGGFWNQAPGDTEGQLLCRWTSQVSLWGESPTHVPRAKRRRQHQALSLLPTLKQEAYFVLCLFGVFRNPRNKDYKHLPKYIPFVIPMSKQKDENLTTI